MTKRRDLLTTCWRSAVRFIDMVMIISGFVLLCAIIVSLIAWLIWALA